MEIHTFEVCADAKKACLAYTGEEQFTMTKMFGSSDGVKFNDEPTVKLFIDQVFGRGAVKKIHSPVRTCAADHMLFVMPPNVKSVNAFCNLLDRMVGEEYHIINVAGNNIKSLTKVKRHIQHYEKTITVTCGRFNTGVTVPEWDVVFMLGDGSAPETYFQTIFRVQSPDKRRGKEKCYVFDFNPERVLELVYTYAELTAKKNKSTKSTLREFLGFAPIIDHSGNKTKIVFLYFRLFYFRLHYILHFSNQVFRTFYLGNRLHQVLVCEYHPVFPVLYRSRFLDSNLPLVSVIRYQLDSLVLML